MGETDYKELFDVETDAGQFYVIAQDFREVEHIIKFEFNLVRVLGMKQMTGREGLSILIPDGRDWR